MTLIKEKDIIEAARNGDAEAISHLYHQHKDSVFRFVYSRVGTQADAEDLFQEVMIAAFDSLQRFKGKVKFLHWCYQIARNKIALFWRGEYKFNKVELNEAQVADMLADEEEMEEENLHLEEELAEQRKQLLRVLDQLPDRYAELLKLRFMEEKTIAEVAKAMGITKNNAKVLQNRALKKAIALAEKLAKEK